MKSELLKEHLFKSKIIHPNLPRLPCNKACNKWTILQPPALTEKRNN